MDTNELMYIFEELFESGGSTNATMVGGENLLYTLEALMNGSLDPAQMGTLIGTLIGGLVGLLFAVALYLVSAISVYSLAKKTNTKLSWLAWIPICQTELCTFVLYKLSGKESFEFINGKLKVAQGIWMVVAYMVASILGGWIITTTGNLIGYIPVIGMLWGFIAFLPNLIFALVLAAFQYVYLRDAIGVFKPDQKKNQTHAFIVTLIDLITGGWARAIYLLTMMKLQPLEVPAFEADVVDAPVSAE